MQVPNTYLLHFLASSKLLLLEPDALILSEGEYNRDAYFLVEGRLTVASLGPDGNQQMVAILSQSEFVGEYGMLTGQPCPVTVQT